MIVSFLPLFLALLLAPAAWAQSSLGQSGTLPPPRAAVPAPTPPPAPAEAQRPTPPTSPRPAAPPSARPPRTAAPAPAPPRAAPAPAPARSAPVVEPRAPGAPRPANRQTQGQALPPPVPPAASGAAPPRRRAPAAAAAAGGAAAGAAAVIRPPEPARPAEPPAPRLGTATGLPLPRFAALGSNQVNLRVGPDLRYPIEWTYQRKDLPVQIVDEHQHWRRIRDSEGTEGWVQRPLLTSRRSFLVQGQERVMRRSPEDTAAEVARLRPGVVGRLRRCGEGSAWCEAQVGDYRGWLKRSEIFGVTADEEVK